MIEQAGYQPEADLEHTPDSVFCSHGAGYPVKWNEVEQHMHLPLTYQSAGGEKTRRTGDFSPGEGGLQQLGTIGQRTQEDF